MSNLRPLAIALLIIAGVVAAACAIAPLAP
jgi:hypothetical protein